MLCGSMGFAIVCSIRNAFGIPVPNPAYQPHALLRLRDIFDSFRVVVGDMVDLTVVSLRATFGRPLRGEHVVG